VEDADEAVPRARRGHGGGLGIGEGTERVLQPGQLGPDRRGAGEELVELGALVVVHGPEDVGAQQFVEAVVGHGCAPNPA
jgi:hypothetical protein